MRILTAILAAFVLIGLLGYGMTKKVSKTDMPAAVQTALEELGSTFYKGDTGKIGARGPQGPKGDNGHDGTCVGACCYGGCIPRFVEVVPMTAPKPRLVFNQSFNAAQGATMTVTVNGTPVPVSATK